jgi:hypothetical protein
MLNQSNTFLQISALANQVSQLVKRHQQHGEARHQQQARGDTHEQLDQAITPLRSHGTPDFHG